MEATEKPVSYRSTILACYLGYFVQAVIVNLTPILFIPLRQQFNLTFEQMGRLVLINFVTQVIVDLALSKPVEWYGIRPFAVASNILAALGLIFFAFAPQLFTDAYTGFTVATILFSAGGGLLELVLSPIVNAIPTDEKVAAMSALHSFYSWGQVAVVLATTLLVALLGGKNWYLIVLMWTLLPLINFIAFTKVPLAPMVPEEHRTKLRNLFKERFFLVAILALVFGGAAEQIMAQWTSTFLEKAMKLPKMTGDIVGVCMFAGMMGLGRACYGKYGSKIDIYQTMLWGCALTVVCYIIVVVSPWATLSLIACALCGLAVSLLWPGSLVISANRFPLAGASMFAVLASGGDSGASIGPWLVGLVADKASAWSKITPNNLNISSEELGLRAGIACAIIFPLAMFFCLKYLIKKQNNKNDTPNLPDID
jgi:fucose permease